MASDAGVPLEVAEELPRELDPSNAGSFLIVAKSKLAVHYTGELSTHHGAVETLLVGSLHMTQHVHGESPHPLFELGYGGAYARFGVVSGVRNNASTPDAHTRLCKLMAIDSELCASIVWRKPMQI